MAVDSLLGVSIDVLNGSPFVCLFTWICVYVTNSRRRSSDAYQISLTASSRWRRQWSTKYRNEDLNLDWTQSLTITFLLALSLSVPKNFWRLKTTQSLRDTYPPFKLSFFAQFETLESLWVLSPYRALSKLDLTVIGSSQKLTESWGQPWDKS